MKYKENDYRFGRPPKPLRQTTVRLDNIAVVPASLLPFKEQWQQVANGLPAGSTLLVLPPPLTRPRVILERLAVRLRAAGQRVTMLQASDVATGFADPDF
jgi:hypothetical protein